MKKTLIATAVAASVMAPISAHAINFSADGTGEVLLYPYYNVNQGNATFIGVANTTGEVKVLKVRFREGVESEDVLDFQVWLSPYDHWTAVMFQVGGNVNISTSDTSCTVPSLASCSCCSGMLFLATVRLCLLAPAKAKPTSCASAA